MDMAEVTLKLSALLDQFVSQPGTTNDTRRQVERMKVSVNELEAFVGNASQNLDSHAMALHLDEILSSISNIIDRGNMLRAAAQNLAVANQCLGNDFSLKFSPRRTGGGFGTKTYRARRLFDFSARLSCALK